MNAKQIVDGNSISMFGYDQTLTNNWFYLFCFPCLIFLKLFLLFWQNTEKMYSFSKIPAVIESLKQTIF